MQYNRYQQQLPFPPATGEAPPDGSVLRFRSSRGNTWHTVSSTDKSCDCDEFYDKRGNCEHLGALGLYRVRPFRPSTYPTFSQALSALVKSLRIRRVEEAIYWLLYLETFTEREFRFRTARRLLIGSAEDGHSVAVMEAVSGNFRALCSRRQTSVSELAEEAVRICKVPNWWNPVTGGPDYIYSGMIGQRQLARIASPRTVETMTKLIERGITEKKKSMALAGVMGLSDARLSGTKRAELILDLATRCSHSVAERLARIHLHSRTALSGDDNLLCHAVWWMTGGVSPVADVIEPVTRDEVVRLLDQAKERWKNPQPIPGWCVDGLHTSGTDVRFAGLWHHMHAVCKAFEWYGRVDPNDAWRPEFWCHDGMVVEVVKR